jgi:hypothetical protein
MVLRDKRLWFGVIAAVILAFVSYAVVADLNRSGPGHPVSDTSTSTAANDPTTGSTSTTPPPAGEAVIPVVVGDRMCVV